MALFCLSYLRLHPAQDAWKKGLWTLIFGCLVGGSVLGALAHGLLIPAVWQVGLWGLIYLLLATVVAGIAVAAVYDLQGVAAARWAARVMVVLVLLFLLVVKLMHGEFTPFVLFEGLALLAAGTVYAYLGLARGQRGAFRMLSGIAVTLLAAALQALHLGAFVFIWPFNHNGVFHLVQLPGLFFILFGLRASSPGD